MSEVMSAVPVPAADPFHAVTQAAAVFNAAPGLVPGSVCPTCGHVVPKPSKPSVFARAFKRVRRAFRVVLHDPVVDRAGKSLAGILVVRALVALGASAQTVLLAQHILHHFGV